MTSDHRITPGLIHDILDALERHGYHRGDDLHADRAIGLIGDLACIYEGTQDHPAATYHGPPSPPAYPDPSQPGRHHPDPRRRQHRVRRAGYRRRRQALPRRECPDCPDQSCPVCQTHLHDAQAFDQMADRMLQAAQAAPGASQPGQNAGSSPPPTGRQASDVFPPETGQTQTGRQADTPRIPGPRPGEKDIPETAEPYDLPFPTDGHRTPGVRDRRRPAPRLAAGPAPSLAELLEAGPARTLEPEPDLEAEP